MRKHVMWAIRDARGLPRGAKQVAHLVESRGTFTSGPDTAADDLSVDRATYYRWRKEADAHKLIRRAGGGLVVDSKQVASYVPSNVLARYWPCSREHSESSQQSHGATAESHGATRSRNASRNTKRNVASASADADRQLLADTLDRLGEPLSADDVAEQLRDIRPDIRHSGAFLASLDDPGGFLSEHVAS